LGQINFINHEDGYLFNNEFNPELVKYDGSYSTENKYHLEKSIESFEKIMTRISGYRFVEIGCGQGEFVDFLRSKGIDAQGFDPVCRNSRDYIVKEFFDLSSITKVGAEIVFVMRCVLPHIVQPFDFLDRILEKFPSALILMQHQRIEFFAATRSWNSIMHDHVNLFRDNDFDMRYEVLSSATFSDSEWRQILIRKSNRQHINSKAKGSKLFETLVDSRKEDLDILKNIENLFIFGAAGKGINFAFACAQNGVDTIAAVDDQDKIWGQYLEGSGVQVLSPQSLSQNNAHGTLVVMNHNHLESAKKRFSKDFRVVSLMSFTKI